jgi:group I intron endonuclease
MIGIYKITSPSGKIYIGQSTRLEERKKSYKRLECTGQTRLYRSLLKYSFSEHIFEIIEECTIGDLNIRERYWQDYYGVLSKKGLNCKLTGTNDQSGKLSIESILKRVNSTDYKIRAEKYYKSILQYSLEGVFIREWNSGKEASQVLGINRSSITDCMKGRKNTSGGFIWKYKTDKIENTVQSVKPKEELTSERLSKPILQYTLSGILLGEWKSATHAYKVLGIPQGDITGVCRERLVSAGGFIWKYRTNSMQKVIHVGKVGRELAAAKTSKAVLQTNLEGTFIQEWKSIREAGETLKINRSNITACCKGKLKSAGGFIWEYAK